MINHNEGLSSSELVYRASLRNKMVLEVVRSKDGATIKEIIELTGLAKATVQHRINMLRVQGLIQCTGYGPGARWCTNDNLEAAKAKVIELRSQQKKIRIVQKEVVQCTSHIVPILRSVWDLGGIIE